MKKLPKVNRHLAEKLMAQTEDATIKKKKKVEAKNVLADDRFSAMFERPEFQVDMESEEYRLINPLMSQMDKVGSFFLQATLIHYRKRSWEKVMFARGRVGK